VVSFTPGGAPDTLARVLAEDWQKTLGVPILVDNRPGHGGNIGADLVAKSNPDGYTLLIGTVGIHAINGALYEKLPYDPIADFTPISFLASTPNVLIVNKQLGTTLKRSPSAPDIPTLAEQGLRGFEAVSWFSLMAPAKLPKEIQARLNQLTVQTLSKPEIRSRLSNGGLDPNPGSPEELSRYIQQEASKWRKIVQQSGARAE